MAATDSARSISFRWRKAFLSTGIAPASWRRIARGSPQAVFYPALHGTTHFCCKAIERNLDAAGRSADLLRTLEGRHPLHPLAHAVDRIRVLGCGEIRGCTILLGGASAGADWSRGRMVCQTVFNFAQISLRSGLSRRRRYAIGHGRSMGCGWRRTGLGALIPPHFDRHSVLQVCRTVEFEPATNPSCSVDVCVAQAESCFQRGLPAIVSLHSINFHSTVRDFRSRTLRLLDEFLSALESRHADLLYLHDEDLYEIVSKETYRAADGKARVNVSRRKFAKAHVARPMET